MSDKANMNIVSLQIFRGADKCRRFSFYIGIRPLHRQAVNITRILSGSEDA